MQLIALPMFNMVWLIYLTTVKLDSDWFFFILKSFVLVVCLQWLTPDVLE